MKKLFYFTGLIATVFLLNSCSEEDPAQAVDVDGTFTGKATIEGNVYLNTNQSSTELIEYVPEGTVLSFAIDYASLGLGSQGRYVKTAAVNANGHYLVELPTRADGLPVVVSITGAQIQLTITTPDGKSKDQVFEVPVNVTQEIVRNLVYLKKIEYRLKETLRESETWENGTFRATLRYYNGKEDRFAPENTEVKITVSKDAFVPKRTNDLILIGKVGANGLLELKIPAPSLLNGGLSFKLESVFIAEYVTNVVRNTTVSCTYTLTSMATVYGGETISGRTLLYRLDNQVGEDPERPWTTGTYTVKLVYYTGAYDSNNNLVQLPVPTETPLEVVIPNYTLTGEDYRFVTTVKNNGIVTFDLKAPAAGEGQLQLQIKSASFIAEAVSGNAGGNYIYNDYLFYTPVIWSYMYGEKRTVDGGIFIAERGNQLK
jgi:hypothetical protein